MIHVTSILRCNSFPENSHSVTISFTLSYEDHGCNNHYWNFPLFQVQWEIARSSVLTKETEDTFPLTFCVSFIIYIHAEFLCELAELNVRVNSLLRRSFEFPFLTQKITLEIFNLGDTDLMKPGLPSEVFINI